MRVLSRERLLVALEEKELVVKRKRSFVWKFRASRPRRWSSAAFGFCGIMRSLIRYWACKVNGRFIDIARKSANFLAKLDVSPARSTPEKVRASDDTNHLERHVLRTLKYSPLSRKCTE